MKADIGKRRNFQLAANSNFQLAKKLGIFNSPRNSEFSTHRATRNFRLTAKHGIVTRRGTRNFQSTAERGIFNRPRNAELSTHRGKRNLHISTPS